MTDRLRRGLIVGCSAFLLGILVSMPQWLHMLSDQYKGIAVHLNADEFGYLPRVEDALRGRGDQLGMAVTGAQENAPLLQSALIERVYGALFGWTGWHAATLLNVMDFVIPFFLFLVLVGFCRACGLSRKQAFIAAGLFSLLELYNLGRPIHQRTSFLLLLCSLWAITEGMQRQIAWGVLGGVLLGLLMEVYFWSWTAGWAWLAILFVFECALWIHAYREEKHRSPVSMLLQVPVRLYHRLRGHLTRAHTHVLRMERLAIFGAVGFFFAIPGLVHMRAQSGYEAYTDVFFRSGIASSHVPESWVWSTLFAVMAVMVTYFWIQKRTEKHMFAAVTVVTAFGVLNQHVLHGVRFVFASHYLFFLVLAAVLTAVILFEYWRTKFLVGVLAAALFLAGIGYDNRSVFAQWSVDQADFEEQHLASALPFLRSIPATTVLSDPLTSSVIASYTDHNVLFTHYIQHELHTHFDIANRYCLTQVFKDPYDRHPEEEHVLVYGAAYDAIDDPVEHDEVRQEELRMVQYACSQMDSNPLSLLQGFGVRYILWDEKRQPAWNMNRNALPVSLIEQGEGWSLWYLQP